MMHLVPFAALLAVLSLVPLAQPRVQTPPTQEQRTRWEEKSDAERATLRARFEEFRSLAPEERDELVERAKRLSALRDLVRERAPAEERRAAEELDRARRDAFWRARGIDAARRIGERLRAELPPRLRERLEGATPKEREQLLRRFRREVKERITLRTIQRLARELDLAVAEVERLQSLPPEARLREVLELERRLVERRVSIFGLPPWMTSEELERLRALPTPEFLSRWRAAQPLGQERREGPPRSPPPAIERERRD
jgi:hypothetical protein